MINNKPLWKIDKQGNLNYHLRMDHAGELYTPDTIWERPVVTFILMILCAILDYVVFKQLFAVILYDQADIQKLSVLGCLIAFDVAPIYLGLLMKRHQQGFQIDWNTVYCLLIAFLLVCIGNLWLRITVKDILVPGSSASNTSVFNSIEGSGSKSEALPYAIFSSLLPFATSLVSYGASYISANPLKARVKKLHVHQIQLEDAINQVNSILQEYEEDAELGARLLAEDNQMYLAAEKRTQELGFWYGDYVRERIKEHLGDPAATNELSKDVRQQLEKMLATMPELPQFTPESTKPHVITTKEVA